MLQVFQLFRTYVASVSSRCYKSRSGVAHVAVGPICGSHLLQLLGSSVCVWVWRGHHGVWARDTEQCGTQSVPGTWCGRETRSGMNHGAGAGHGMSQDTKRTRATVRCVGYGVARATVRGTRHGASTRQSGMGPHMKQAHRCGRPDASPGRTSGR